MSYERQRILLIAGVGGAREQAIAESLSGEDAELFTTARNFNPGIKILSSRYLQHDETDIEFAARYAEEGKPSFAFIGSEQPLVAGIVDRLARSGIPAVGPTKEAAQIEGSKLFLRQLMSKYGIAGNVEYHHIQDVNQHVEILETGREFAIKPIGLTNGKGVKVMGEHLFSVADAIDYGNQIISDEIGGKQGFLLEERLKGPEFTLQSFTDGNIVLPMPLVRDYKKAYEGDVGPNTGSMGSYSQEDGLLPFVNQAEYDQAVSITRQIVAALLSEGIRYKGVLYSQFFKTASGLRVAEENCRFGDPEALNSLMVLRIHLPTFSEALIAERLNEIRIDFRKKATVVRYIAPPGYPDSPESGVPIGIARAEIAGEGGRLFYAQVAPRTDGISGVVTTLSRTLAIGASGETVGEAERKVTRSMTYITGKYHARNDIGREELLRKDRIGA